VVHTPEGSTLRVCEGVDADKAIWRTIEVEPVITNFQRFAKAVQKGQPDEPGFAHAAKLQFVLDHAVKTAGALVEL
jgi:predicted dehydrogenase